MRKLVPACVLLFACCATAQTKTPVLVELFTSEGCSSCPPADQLLIRLDTDQPVAGADVIVLGEHVDYWDQDGWQDRFSSHALTDRQQAYANRFRIDGPYTPQMVVNGAVEFVGNDADKAIHTIERAASPHSAPVITLQRSANNVHIRVDNAGPGQVNVMYAITERDLSTQVGNGENRGRQLHHTAVVRELRKLGATRGGRFEADFPVHVAPGWHAENLRAVVFLQEGAAGKIDSAAQIPIQ